MKTILSAAALLLFCSAQAFAQESFFTEAATMPAPGGFVLRQMYRYTEMGHNPNTGSTESDRHEWISSLQIGLARDLSLRVLVPVEWKSDSFPNQSDTHDEGVSDIDLLLKWRFHKDDSAGIDTFRAALLGGAAVASGDNDDFSSQSVNPIIGATATLVRGRHGFNQDLLYRFNTGGKRDANDGGEGPDDALRHNTSYLYRIFPEAYTSESTGAWYLIAEMSGLYETNGDYELLAGPGIMYEARRIAVEAAIQFPLLSEVDERAETDLRLGIGIRILF